MILLMPGWQRHLCCELRRWEASICSPWAPRVPWLGFWLLYTYHNIYIYIYTSDISNNDITSISQVFCLFSGYLGLAVWRCPMKWPKNKKVAQAAPSPCWTAAHGSNLTSLTSVACKINISPSKLGKFQLSKFLAVQVQNPHVQSLDVNHVNPMYCL